MAELPNTALQSEGSDQEECFESSCHDSLKTSSSSSTCSLEEEEIPGAAAPASSKGSKLFGEDEISESSTLRLEVAEDNDLFQDVEADWWPTPPSLSDVEEHIAARNGDLLGTACDRAVENADALFQRIVRERSTELNELQNAARPVTGTNARDNLLEFFNRALDPSPRPNPNQERSLPEDVQRLVQRSIVTSALRRQGFRSVLEQSLAAQLTTTQRNPLPLARVPIRRRSPSGTSTPSVSAQESDAASITSDATTEQFNDNVSEAASEIEQLQRAIDVGVQALSETIEEDLTQLHHLHVVSTALGGDFRDNLERLVQQRVSSVGGGELVQRFIRSLPSAPIPQPRTQPRTPTAARRNSSQPVARGSHLNLPSEIASLKQQVDEMKRVMQMSLEMQMDTQRAIRQEVSAVFGAFMQQMAQASASGLPAHQTTAPSNNPTPVTAGSCVICLDQQVDTVLYQCGHMCVCNGCGLRLKMQGHKCPMCRAPIRDVIRAYKSQ